MRAVCWKHLLGLVWLVFLGACEPAERPPDFALYRNVSGTFTLAQGAERVLSIRPFSGLASEDQDIMPSTGMGYCRDRPSLSVCLHKWRLPLLSLDPADFLRGTTVEAAAVIFQADGRDCLFGKATSEHLPHRGYPKVTSRFVFCEGLGVTRFGLQLASDDPEPDVSFLFIGATGFLDTFVLDDGNGLLSECRFARRLSPGEIRDLSKIRISCPDQFR